MSNLSELAMDLRMQGTSVGEIAKKLKVASTSISRVCAGSLKSREIEKELIRRKCGYLLKKVQIKTGIFDQERFDKMVEEIKGENNGSK